MQVRQKKSLPFIYKKKADDWGVPIQSSASRDLVSGGVSILAKNRCANRLANSRYAIGVT
jgi:hypothetical protein